MARTAEVIYCEACKFCNLNIHDYHRTGERPYDPYLSCVRPDGNFTGKVHADSFCSFAEKKEE